MQILTLNTCSSLVITCHTVLMLMTLLSFKKRKASTWTYQYIWNVFFFSSLKINKENCEIAGITTRKKVKVAVCRMEYIDLTEDTIKMLGIYFS